MYRKWAKKEYLREKCSLYSEFARISNISFIQLSRKSGGELPSSLHKLFIQSVGSPTMKISSHSVPQPAIQTTLVDKVEGIALAIRKVGARAAS